MSRVNIAQLHFSTHESHQASLNFRMFVSDTKNVRKNFKEVPRIAMYRHQEQLTFEEDQFVNRIYNLPVMTAAIDQLNALYTRTKERNRLLRFTMETAELGLSIAVSTAKPVVAKFEKQSKPCQISKTNRVP